MNSNNQQDHSNTPYPSTGILLPTCYLPPVSYFYQCLKPNELYVEILETYPKQTLRNRCFILGPNDIQMLSIPVSRPSGNHTKTKDILINNSLPWQKQHWRSIETAYNKSPFLLYYQDHFYPFYEQPMKFLIDFNEGIRERIFEIFQIDKKVQHNKVFEKTPNNLCDLRNAFSDKIPQPPIPEYHQVFSAVHGFVPNLSILDLICNLGPESIAYLRQLKVS